MSDSEEFVRGGLGGLKTHETGAPESISEAFTWSNAKVHGGDFKRQHYIAVGHVDPLRLGIVKFLPLLHVFVADRVIPLESCTFVSIRIRSPSLPPATKAQPTRRSKSQSEPTTQSTTESQIPNMVQDGRIKKALDLTVR